MKKGFTLIELLAVIVILAIIALITIPTLTKVVEQTKVKASVQSANGYIDAINKQIMANELSKTSIINDDTYDINDLKVNVKGNKPTNGIITIEKSNVKEARLCINKYSIDYNENEIKISSNDYCGETNVTILSNGTIINPKKSNNVFTLDLTGKTNINCSNGATPILEDNKLTVKNAIGNTTCDIGSSLKYTFTHLHDGDNNIVMVSDETISSMISIKKDKKAVLDLKGKKIIYKNLDDPDETKVSEDYDLSNFIFDVYGKLIVNDKDNNGYMKSYAGSASFIVRVGSYVEINGGEYVGGRSVLNTGGTLVINKGIFDKTKYNVIRSNKSSSKTVINGGLFIKNDSLNYAVISIGAGNFTINDGYFESNIGSTINFTANNESLYINGGKFIARNSYVLTHSGNGNIYINQTNKPIYMRSEAVGWKPTINNMAGNLYIKANIANKCTNIESDTKNGLCIYAKGDGSGKISTNGNLAILNTGNAYIDGGTYIGGYHGIENDNILNINNAVIFSDRNAIRAKKNSVANICNSTLNSLSTELIIWNNDNIDTTTTLINYSSNNVFSNGTNVPVIGNNSTLSSINANYTGTCIK